VSRRRSLVSLISLVLTLIVIGVLLWAAKRYVPMDPAIQTLLTVVVVICVILWLLHVFGVLNLAETVTVPRVR
jgi:hypothetical protein